MKIDNALFKNCSFAHAIDEFNAASGKLQELGLLPADHNGEMGKAEKATLRFLAAPAARLYRKELAQYEKCVSGDLTDVQGCCIASGVPE